MLSSTVTHSSFNPLTRRGVSRADDTFRSGTSDNFIGGQVKLRMGSKFGSDSYADELLLLQTKLFPLQTELLLFADGA